MVINLQRFRGGAVQNAAQRVAIDLPLAPGLVTAGQKRGPFTLGRITEAKGRMKRIDTVIKATGQQFPDLVPIQPVFRGESGRNGTHAENKG